MRRTYCIDTSSIINAWNDVYRPSSFPSFWERIDTLIDEGYLISPEEVRNEIKKPDDLVAWARLHDSMFIEFDTDLQVVLKVVLNDLNEIVKRRNLRFTGRDLKADSFVVALAKSKNAVVITQEGVKGNQGKPKIPDLCNTYGIKCIKIPDLITEEEWTF